MAEETLLDSGNEEDLETPPDNGGVSDSGDQSSGAQGEEEASAEVAKEEPVIDWRVRAAGEDEKLAKWLGRYQSENAAFAALKKHGDDIASGKYIKPLGEDATDEEKAAWRKSNGVPDAPEGYLEKLPDGLTIGEDDKPAVDSFVKAMHDLNAPASITQGALKAYYALVEEQEAAAADANEAAKAKGEDALREEWGADYRRNLNALHNYLETVPEVIQDAVLGSVGPDGIRLANNPEFLKWMTGISLERNPHATVVTNTSGDPVKAIDAEIAELEDYMAKHRKAWFADDAKQSRYQELVNARDRMKD
jgi:hypothetical protein